MLIAIDCGTTNMRCRLFDGDVIRDEVCRKVGCRNTAFDGTINRLKFALRRVVEELIVRNTLSDKDIEVILASGTLSSDMGICPIGHSIVPVGINESAAHAQLVS